MDDRFYLAVYDEERMQSFRHLEQRDVEKADVENRLTKSGERILKPEDYVCDVVLPGYEFCETGGFQAIRRSRFSEAAGRLYRLEEKALPLLDQLMAPELVRHQAMAADEERLYNVYVYVAEGDAVQNSSVESQ